MYRFGINSKIKLGSVHKDLALILNEAIKVSKIDFGVSEGHRGFNRQRELFLEGKSSKDGVIKVSKHQSLPSMAADIYIYHPNNDVRASIIYDYSHLAYVAGVIDVISQFLFDEGEISYKVRWGGNWDGDGVIKYDQKLIDYPHFELVEA